MHILKRALTVLAMTAVVPLAVLGTSGPRVALAAYTVPNWGSYCNHAYCFYRYDSEINPPEQPTASNADNPITTVFTNALPADAWSLFSESGQFPETGSVYNSADWELSTGSSPNLFADQSYGVKTLSCGHGSQTGWDTHVRLYPDSSLGYGALYDPYWGYFVLADTHEDYECSPTDYGYAEQAEGYVRQVMGANNVSCGGFGYLSQGQPCVVSIQNDAWYFGNVEKWPGDTAISCGADNGYRPYLNGTQTVDYSHCLENDGYTSVINVSYWSSH